MAGHSKHGFNADQINNPDHMLASLEVSYNAKQKGGTYGVAVAGRGFEGGLWGAGIAANPEPLMAYGIKRLLGMFPDSLLIIQGHENFWKHIQPVFGYIRPALEPCNFGRTTGGKEYHGFEPIAEVAQALDNRRFIYRPVAKLKKGDFHPTRWAALGLAMSFPARDAFVMRHEAKPHCLILAEGVA